MANPPETGIGRVIPPFRYSAEMCGRMIKALNRVSVDTHMSGTIPGVPHTITEETRLLVYSTLKSCVEEVRNAPGLLTGEGG